MDVTGHKEKFKTVNRSAVISVTECKLWSHHAGRPHPPSLPPAIDTCFTARTLWRSLLSVWLRRNPTGV
ncbi:hypothetical protein Q7C36_004497 [Tachysurus vachellii]|uniref:Uncharacterized protein n=1 Tax=Tachysurus vachellii TaxID=175792 RepID=A0AA88NIN0_TACVA|nr:hypothetical protein Q7C36_004497 [Tachysurus vachellii]